MVKSSAGVFKINALLHKAESIEAEIIIDEASEILNGHFPGQPVVPGACMVQLVKDVLEEVLQISLLQKRAGSIKFISMLLPDNSLPAKLFITYKIEDDGVISVNAKLLNNNAACFKFQAAYITKT